MKIIILIISLKSFIISNFFISYDLKSDYSIKGLIDYEDYVNIDFVDSFENSNSGSFDNALSIGYDYFLMKNFGPGFTFDLGGLKKNNFSGSFVNIYLKYNHFIDNISVFLSIGRGIPKGDFLNQDFDSGRYYSLGLEIYKHIGLSFSKNEISRGDFIDIENQTLTVTRLSLFYKL